MSRKSGRAKTRSRRRRPNRLAWGLALVAVLAIVVSAAILLSGGSSDDAKATPLASQLTPPVADATPIPAPVTPPPCVPPGDWVVHTVGEGETLYSLAEHFETDVETLKFVNCLGSVYQR